MAKITWETQETLKEEPAILDKNKWTAAKANETKDSVNALYDLTPFSLTTDISGVMQNDLLAGKNIGTIIGGGAIFEEDEHFTKNAEDDIITMISPNEFSSLTKYRLIPRQ